MKKQWLPRKMFPRPRLRSSQYRKRAISSGTLQEVREEQLKTVEVPLEPSTEVTEKPGGILDVNELVKGTEV
ncbi:hypothetical protein Ddye_029451 [Dipteronia dyeriana]|uniref:Uncharacterized protein n=1 Tax=Dipteronia dyeriana TaxID=168575 RepID=A0AAD9TEG1_9ROSI|nr:hypothetical protein Ddye_029451 [Dipteronia dyeriana]